MYLFVNSAFASASADIVRFSTFLLVGSTITSYFVPAPSAVSSTVYAVLSTDTPVNSYVYVSPSFVHPVKSELESVISLVPSIAGSILNLILSSFERSVTPLSVFLITSFPVSFLYVSSISTVLPVAANSTSTEGASFEISVPSAVTFVSV